ncbi:hypothetical protein CWI39_0145p0020 [Hamiltosporidium magnivora]|uniref:Cullin family profile domain-containing protein n=1 Tax=Hamiltosporidium magnivora TaxID=148818 RepID=A0A4Q9LKK7_9MICR|nr:hypothetical protein CWI39_0145p0020 [Hamiltosporidium magnivora]
MVNRLENQIAENMKRITLSILKRPDYIDSNDYVYVYNNIYKHCTAITDDYEIQGKPIYDLLQEIINEHTSRIEQLISLERFIDVMKQYEMSINVLKSLYSYLSRYFIKISLDRRDGYIQDIETLGYSFFYRNYLESIEKTLLEMIYFEFDIVRTYKKVKNTKLKLSIDYYRKLLAFSDEDSKFNIFKINYLNNLFKKIDFNDNISNISKIIVKEMLIINKIFELEVFYELISKLISKFEERGPELINFVIETMDINKSTPSLYHVIKFMGDKNLKLFFIKYSEKIEISAKICETLEDFLNCFIINNSHIDKSFEADSKLKTKLIEIFTVILKVKNQTKKVLISDGKFSKDFIDEIVEEINLIMNLEEKDYKKLDALLLFLKILDEKEISKYKIIDGIQKRLLFNKSELKAENIFIDLLKTRIGSDYIGRLTKSIKDIETNYSNKIAVKIGESCNQISYYRNAEADSNIKFVDEKNECNQKNKKIKSFMMPNLVLENNENLENSCFLLNIKILTKGFWNILPEQTILAEPLQKILNENIQSHLLKNPRCVLEFNFTLSVIEIEFKNFNIKLSTDLASILLFIENNGNLNFTELKMLSNDQNLKNNLEKLLNTNLIKYDSGNYLINYDFDSNESNLNLFEENYTSFNKTSDKIIENFKSSKVMILQAKIVKKLKIENKILQEELLKYFISNQTEDAILLDAAIKELTDKEYVKISDGFIIYIP